MARRKKKSAASQSSDTSVAVASPLAASEALKDAGNAAFAGQRYVDAVELYDQALALQPDNFKIYSNRSAAFAALQKYDEALQDANAVIQMNGDWSKGHFRRGFALEKLLRFEEAKQAYDRAVELNAGDELARQHADGLEALLSEMRLGKAALVTGGAPHPERDKFDRLVEWMRANNAHFPGLYLQYYSEESRGVHCLAKLPPDNVCLYVPLELIMTSEKARDSPLGRMMTTSGVELRSKHSYLAAFLLEERAKGPASYWWPYIAILPEKYSTIPLFFDEEQLALLEGSFTLHKIAERIDALRREYDAIRRAVPAFRKYSHADFVWARLVVITRIFGLVINNKKTDGLVPYADMLNHKRPRETKWTFDNSKYGFVITTLTTIQRGAQLFDSYGRKCNSRFFVNYGFALAENYEDNEAVLRVRLPADDAAFAMKLRMLGGGRPQSSVSGKREFQVPGNYKEKKAKELFSFLRFAHAKDSELLLLSASDGFKLSNLAPISIRNELLCLRDIAAAARASLALFPTDYASDCRLLQDYDEECDREQQAEARGEPAPPRTSPLHDFNTRNCVLVRHGEKHVLTYYAELAELGSRFLNMAFKDFKKQQHKSKFNESSPFFAYVNEVVVPLLRGVS